MFKSAKRRKKKKQEGPHLCRLLCFVMSGFLIVAKSICKFRSNLNVSARSEAIFKTPDNESLHSKISNFFISLSVLLDWTFAKEICVPCKLLSVKAIIMQCVGKKIKIVIC